MAESKFFVPVKGTRIRMIVEGAVREADTEGVEFEDGLLVEWEPGGQPKYRVVVPFGPGDVATYLTLAGNLVRLFYMRPLKGREGWYDSWGDLHEGVNPYRLVNVHRGLPSSRAVPNV